MDVSHPRHSTSVLFIFDCPLPVCDSFEEANNSTSFSSQAALADLLFTPHNPELSLPPHQFHATGIPQFEVVPKR